MSGDRFASRMLIAAGLVLLGIFAGIRLDGQIYQHRAAHELERLRSRPASAKRLRVAEPARGRLIGWISVPRVGVSAAVSQGTERRDLLRAAGHIEGTAMPGDAAGNVCIAGHRDMHFHKLEGVRAGDLIEITTQHGRFDYVVDSTRVVTPDRTDILAPSETSTLTLVTCYPFRYVGRAPKRFIVHATLKAGDASPPESGGFTGRKAAGTPA